uniref:Transposase n=1 Tax=Syphacia muris TaxID=451379 RepID=A0A0N5AWX9_9BILA
MVEKSDGICNRRRCFFESSAFGALASLRINQLRAGDKCIHFFSGPYLRPEEQFLAPFHWSVRAIFAEWCTIQFRSQTSKQPLGVHVT